MASINLPLSVGTTSRLANVGMQVDKGVNGSLRYALLYKPQERINWTTSFNFRWGKGFYDKIGKNLDQINKENLPRVWFVIMTKGVLHLFGRFVPLE